MLWRSIPQNSPEQTPVLNLGAGGRTRHGEPQIRRNVAGLADASNARRQTRRAQEELRKSRSIIQASVAEYLRTNQGEISRIERRTDLYISTLAQYIRAPGGKLEIRAVFPDSEVRITKFNLGCAPFFSPRGPGR